MSSRVFFQLEGMRLVEDFFVNQIKYDLCSPLIQVLTYYFKKLDRFNLDFFNQQNLKDCRQALVNLFQQLIIIAIMT